jgi:hypothetical protein
LPGEEKLEQILRLVTELRELRRWLVILHAHEDLVVAPIITALASLTPSDLGVAFSFIMGSVNVGRMSRRAFLTIVEAKFKVVVPRDCITLMEMLNPLFLKTLKDLNTVNQFARLTDSVTQSVRPLLVGAVRGLARLDAADLCDRFRILLTVIEYLQFVQKSQGKSDEIYPIIFQQSTGQQLFSTYLLLTTFALQHPFFVALCTDEENRMWVKLESAILVVLKSDRTFLEAYAELHSALVEVALSCWTDPAKTWST